MKGQLAGKLTESLAAATALREVCEATAAASGAHLLEADQCKQAAVKHAQDVCEDFKKAYRQEYETRVAQADSKLAEEEKEAEKVFDAALLAVANELEKKTQPWRIAQAEAAERMTEQKQVLSSQEEVLRQLTPLLHSIDGAHKVCLHQLSFYTALHV